MNIKEHKMGWINTAQVQIQKKMHGSQVDICIKRMFQLVFPPCFQRAGRTQKALYESSVSPFVWTSCAENGCLTFYLNQQSVGGR